MFIKIAQTRVQKSQLSASVEDSIVHIGKWPSDGSLGFLYYSQTVGSILCVGFQSSFFQLSDLQALPLPNRANRRHFLSIHGVDVLVDPSSISDRGQYTKPGSLVVRGGTSLSIALVLPGNDYCPLADLTADSGLREDCVFSSWKLVVKEDVLFSS